MSDWCNEYNTAIGSALKPFLLMPLDANAVKSAVRSSIENSLLDGKADHLVHVDKENRTVSVQIIMSQSVRTLDLNFSFS